MNFFEHQARARRSSAWLVTLFVLAVVGIVMAVNVAALIVSGGWGPNTGGVMVLFSLLTLAVIGLGSLYRIASLRSGGEAVALQLGGREVPSDTRDPQLRRLRNVVEEIAIASGVTMPRLFVLEEEAGINAFAAGYSPADAAIAVTRGCLERLNRDELQGVIAHEFSHILNGDMRLNIRLMGVMFGILMLSVIGRKVLQLGVGRRSRNVSVVLVMGLAALVIGSIGVFFGRLIKAAVSRQRELLADASAVQFTRQTAGLVGALKKIGGLEEGSALRDRAGAEEVSHMLFGEGAGFSRWFATHPPLPQRIRLLDPSFREDQLGALQARWQSTPPDGMEEDRMMGLAPPALSTRPATPLPLPGLEGGMITPAQVAAQVATPGDDDYLRAAQLVASLPGELAALAHDREAAMPLLLALLLDADAQVAARQAGEIRARMGEELGTRSLELGRTLAGLHPALRLPLASLTFATLRTRPRPQLQLFVDTVEAVSHADGRISLFEYCLSRLLQAQVQAALDPSRHTHFGRRKTTGVRQEFATLLAVVAQAGNPESPQQARHAYLAGLERVLPRDHLPYAPPANGVQALDAVWGPLDALDPLAKQLVVEAVTATISHNHRVSVAEAELLRTICGVLHCPLPAMLQVA